LQNKQKQVPVNFKKENSKVTKNTKEWIRERILKKLVTARFNLDFVLKDIQSRKLSVIEKLLMIQGRMFVDTKIDIEGFTRIMDAINLDIGK